MSNKQRIQVNVNLSPGQKGQLDALALHYGSTSAAVRVALDALWREFVRSGQVGAAVFDHYAEDTNTDAGPQVNELNV